MQQDGNFVVTFFYIYCIVQLVLMCAVTVCLRCWRWTKDMFQWNTAYVIISLHALLCVHVINLTSISSFLTELLSIQCTTCGHILLPHTDRVDRYVVIYCLSSVASCYYCHFFWFIAIINVSNWCNSSKWVVVGQWMLSGSEMAKMLKQFEEEYLPEDDTENPKNFQLQHHEPYNILSSQKNFQWQVVSLYETIDLADGQSLLGWFPRSTNSWQPQLHRWVSSSYSVHLRWRKLAGNSFRTSSRMCLMHKPIPYMAQSRGTLLHSSRHLSTRGSR